MGEIVEELLIKSADGKTMESPGQNPFFTKQVKIALRNTGLIDPMNIEEYIAVNGYMALGKVLNELKPFEVIELIKESGLRGRGGAGFSTGLKWSFTAKAKGLPKYVLCNADEGDPGAFMDRSILEGDPHSIIEAMTIAGYAIEQIRAMFMWCRVPFGNKTLVKCNFSGKRKGLLGKIY